MGFLVSLIKEFKNGLKQELQDTFIRVYKKIQDGPEVDLSSCPEENRGEEEKHHVE